MNWKKTLLICFVILIAGAGLTTLIFSTEPTASRSGATQETAMLVDVTEIQRGTYRPTIQAMGTVVPSQDIILSPRVSGQIIERAEEFIPGGHVQKGAVLLKIDPADYKNTLRQRRSDLQQAMADLNLEMGRQEAAKKEYQLYGDTLSKQNRALVLRQPQLESARASVNSAQAAVEAAELNLERTTIRAPFDAHILSRNVNVGSQVAPGNNLGRLVGLETYWVEATIPLSKLRWLNISENNRSAGSEVKIRNRTAWQDGEFRTGSLFKIVGTLEEQTRMARVLITVPDPLAYRSEHSGSPSLMIGSFVETSIKAEELEDVIRLNRDYVRQDETVWVMEDGKLRIHEVDIVMQDAEYAYISDGLSEDAKVVTTNLSTVTDGARLRLEESSSETTTQQDTVNSEQ